MTEADAIDALNGVADVAATMVSLWVSFTFAFLNLMS